MDCKEKTVIDFRFPELIQLRLDVGFFLDIRKQFLNGGILAVALIIFLSYLYFKNNDVEWEYALVEKTMYIDKIMKKSKRKRIGEYDLTKTEVMAPEGSSYIKEYDNRNLKCTDFSSLIPENKKYVLIIMDGNEMVKLVLEPDERMLKELRDIIPRQLHID